MVDLEIKARVVEAALVVHGRSLWVPSTQLGNPQTECGLVLYDIVPRDSWSIYVRDVTCPDCLRAIRHGQEAEEYCAPE